MNILFVGSDELHARVRMQQLGQDWVIHRAKDPDNILDFEGTHLFQAALVGLCEDADVVQDVAQKSKSAAKVPVVIGLGSQNDAVEIVGRPKRNLDIVLTECGNDRLTKLQCDAIIRLAHGIPTENITCGGVTYDVSRSTFSINGRDIYLPFKKHMLLELLFLKRGTIVNRDMVFNHLYGWDEPPLDKTIEVFVCQIRRALREAGLTTECIKTVWGQGYTIPMEKAA